MSNVSPEVEELRKKTISLLISVLTSKAKVGIPIHLLCYDYEEQVFEKLKFKEMGYGTLQQFINDSDEFSTHRGMDGHVYVKALPTDETKHIHRLVTGQKTKKKAKKVKLAFPTRRIVRPPPKGKQTSFMFNKNAPFASYSSKPRAYSSTSPLSANAKRTPTNNNPYFNKTKPLKNALPPRFQKTFPKRQTSSIPPNRPFSNKPNPPQQFIIYNNNNDDRFSTSSRLAKSNTSTPIGLYSSLYIYIYIYTVCYQNNKQEYDG